MSDRYARRIYLALAEGRDLSADEELHLAECPSCQSAAERARAFETELHREMAELRRPMPADPRLGSIGERRRPSLGLPLVVAATLVVAVAATVAGTGPLPGLEESPVPTASASGPSPSATPSVSPDPSIGDPMGLEPGDYAMPLVDEVWLHDAVGGRPFAMAQQGAEIWTVDVRDGWYLVQARPSGGAEYVFGWVPAEDEAGAELDPAGGVLTLGRVPAGDCPPADPAAMAFMHPQRRVECFGTKTLELEGYAVGLPVAPVYLGEPGWLVAPAAAELAGAIGPAVTSGAIAMHLPSTDTEVPLSDRESHDGIRLRVTGHFADPASDDCTITPVEPGWLDPNDVQAAAWCAQRFVVDSVEPAEAGPSAAPSPSPSAEPTYVTSVETVEDGIRLRLELSAERGSHGDRTWGRVTVLNEGTDNVYWQAGGCGFPASIEVFPAYGWTLEYGREWPAGSREARIKGALIYQTPDTAEAGITMGFTPEAWVDLEGNFGCTTDWQLGTMAPGEVLTYVGAWDHVGPYEMPAPVGDYRILPTFAYYGRGAEPPDGVESMHPIPNEIVTLTGYELTGEALELVSPGRAVDAVLADEEFMRLVGITQDRWIGGEVAYVDGVWEVRRHLADPDQTIVARVDATTGRLMGIETVPRTEAPRG